MPKPTESTREGGREDSSNLTSGSSGAANAASLAVLQRNSSGSASNAASILDLRQHVNAIEEVLNSMGRNGLLTDEQLMPLRRLQQRGFRRNRG